jgi:hypothetical protein
MSGADSYQHFCSSCHGREGRGDGPLATEMRTTPADLTTLASRSGGQFPRARVQSLLDGTSTTRAHGSAEMPVWGPIFRGLEPTDRAAQARLEVLVSYLQSIQGR